MAANSKKTGSALKRRKVAPPSSSPPGVDTDAFDEPISEDANPSADSSAPTVKKPVIKDQKENQKVQSMRLPVDLIEALEEVRKALDKRSIQGITKSDLIRAFLSMGVERTTLALSEEDINEIVAILAWTGTEFKET